MENNNTNNEELSEESKEWIETNRKRVEKQLKWKEETKYNFNENIDIINNTIHKVLSENLDSWHETHRNDNIYDILKLKEIVEGIEYDLFLSEDNKLDTKVCRTEDGLSGEYIYGVKITYELIMDEDFSNIYKWNFDTHDIIRSNKIRNL